MLLYQQMLRSRRFEERIKELWIDGKISGEMHLGIGEEAIAAGVVAHLEDGDAMALDHRGTPPLVSRGVDMVLLLKELLGRADGLCSGHGGHMHLLSREHLVASSGIVGSSAPLGIGFALAAQYLHPGSIAVSFFGEGAINQGMLLESLNLAVVWNLPILFVCKDNRWAISTHSQSVTGGKIIDRANGFGLPALEVDGTDVEAVWHAARGGVERARSGDGPTFLLAHCPRLEGHFLGDPTPQLKFGGRTGPLLRSLSKREGASVGERITGLGHVFSWLGQIALEHRWKHRDPIDRIRRRLKTKEPHLTEIEQEIEDEVRQAVKLALSAA